MALSGRDSQARDAQAVAIADQCNAKLASGNPPINWDA